MRSIVFFNVFFSLLICTFGCVGTPSPLTPDVHGSVGLPHFGVLTDGVQLPKRTHSFRLFREASVNWGTPRLIGTIEYAAATVHRLRPGAPLLVGDISAKHGGFRTGHKSHRSGRDVDLLLYVMTPDGRSIPSPGFVTFGPDGLAETEKHTFVRFDIDRNWQFVKALVTSPKADVQWIFLARWLEALLIEHARALGEDDEILWRAENVMLQPADSAPHDDHFHLRIACTQDELVHGCDVHGPAWPWLPNPPVLEKVSDEELLSALLEGLLPPHASPPGPLSNSAPHPLTPSPTSHCSAMLRGEGEKSLEVCPDPPLLPAPPSPRSALGAKLERGAGGVRCDIHADLLVASISGWVRRSGVGTLQEAKQRGVRREQ